MNLTDYISLLNNPNAINDKHTLSLGKILNEFSYFQSAHALYLKGLYDQNNFKYNDTLKITAAHTTNRTVLFDFITSDYFTPVQNNTSKTIETSIVTKNSEMSVVKKEDFPILNKNILTDGIEKSTKLLEKKLAIGKPLNFSKDEKFSFQEWLHLTNLQPIKREENASKKDSRNKIELEKQKKIDLIDKFIETNPKIIASKTNTINIAVSEKNVQDNTYLMTETLAKVYLEQKKYQKAIQAYEILILKYPEKSTFFADQIYDIKTLQQNNN